MKLNPKGFRIVMILIGAPLLVSIVIALFDSPRFEAESTLPLIGFIVVMAILYYSFYTSRTIRTSEEGVEQGYGPHISWGEVAKITYKNWVTASDLKKGEAKYVSSRQIFYNKNRFIIHMKNGEIRFIYALGLSKRQIEKLLAHIESVNPAIDLTQARTKLKRQSQMGRLTVVLSIAIILGLIGYYSIFVF